MKGLNVWILVMLIKAKRYSYSIRKKVAKKAREAAITAAAYLLREVATKESNQISKIWRKF